MQLSVHVLDVPGLVLVTTPERLVVLVPPDLEPEALTALGTLLLSAADRATVERVLSGRDRSSVPATGAQRRPPNSE